jgi:hypothetical protein
MTVKSLFSFMKSHQPNESVEQGLLISRRLKELLEIAEVPTSGTPEGTQVGVRRRPTSDCGSSSTIGAPRLRQPVPKLF